MADEEVVIGLDKLHAELKETHKLMGSTDKAVEQLAQNFNVSASASKKLEKALDGVAQTSVAGAVRKITEEVQRIDPTLQKQSDSIKTTMAQIHATINQVASGERLDSSELAGKFQTAMVKMQNQVQKLGLEGKEVIAVFNALKAGHKVEGLGLSTEELDKILPKMQALIGLHGQLSEAVGRGEKKVAKAYRKMEAMAQAHKQALEKQAESHANKLKELEQARVNLVEKYDKRIVGQREKYLQKLEDKEQQHQNALEKQAEKHANKLEGLAQARVNLISKHNATIEALKEKHLQKLEAKEQQHQNALEKQAEKHANKLEELEQARVNLVEKHNKKIEGLKEKHLRKLEAKEQQHQNALEKQAERHANKLKELEQARVNLVEKHDKKIEGLKEKHLQKLEAKEQQHQSVLEKLHAREESRKKQHHQALQTQAARHQQNLQQLEAKRVVLAEKTLAKREAAEKKHALQLYQIQEKHTNRLVELSQQRIATAKKHDKKIESLKEKHRTTLEAKEQAHLHKIEQMQLAHSNKIASIKRRNAVEDDRRFAQALKNMNNLTISWASFLRLVQVQVAHIAFAKLVENIKQSSEALKELERNVSRIRTISQESQLAFDTWRDSVLSLASAYGADDIDVASGAYLVLTNQVAKGVEVFGALRDAMDFARVAVTSTKEGVELSASAINSLGERAEFSRLLLSQFFKTIERGRVLGSEISNTMGRVLPIAQQLGIQVTDVEAALITVTRSGVKTNEALTQIGAVMQKLIKPTVKMREIMDSWGVPSARAAIQTFTFAGVLSKLAEEAAKAGDELGEVGKIFNRERGIRGFATFGTGAGLETFRKELGQLENSAQSFENALAISFESATSRIEIATARLKEHFTKNVSNPVLQFFGEIAKEKDAFVNIFRGAQALLNLPFIATIGSWALAMKLFHNASVAGWARQAAEGQKLEWQMTDLGKRAKILSYQFAATLGPALFVGLAGAAITYFATLRREQELLLQEAGRSMEEWVKSQRKVVQEDVDNRLVIYQQYLNAFKDALSSKTQAYLTFFAKVRTENSSVFSELQRTYEKSGVVFGTVITQQIKASRSLVTALRAGISQMESDLSSFANRFKSLQQAHEEGRRQRELDQAPDDEARLKILRQQQARSFLQAKRLVAGPDYLQAGDSVRKALVAAIQAGQREIDILTNQLQEAFSTGLAPDAIQKQIQSATQRLEALQKHHLDLEEGLNRAAAIKTEELKKQAAEQERIHKFLEQQAALLRSVKGLGSRDLAGIQQTKADLLEIARGLQGTGNDEVVKNIAKQVKILESMETTAKNQLALDEKTKEIGRQAAEIETGYKNAIADQIKGQRGFEAAKETLRGQFQALSVLFKGASFSTYRDPKGRESGQETLDALRRLVPAQFLEHGVTGGQGGIVTQTRIKSTEFFTHLLEQIKKFGPGDSANLEAMIQQLLALQTLTAEHGTGVHAEGGKIFSRERDPNAVEDTRVDMTEHLTLLGEMFAKNAKVFAESTQYIESVRNYMRTVREHQGSDSRELQWLQTRLDSLAANQHALDQREQMIDLLEEIANNFNPQLNSAAPFPTLPEGPTPAPVPGAAVSFSTEININGGLDIDAIAIEAGQQIESKVRAGLLEFGATA